MATPRFSVITAVCNGARTLGDAIRSVKAQSEPSWEHIIVDNGSSDGTPQLVGSLPSPSLRYLRIEERNRSLARNIGIDIARGEYLLFLDADDWLLPNALADHVRFLSRNPAYGVSVSDGWFCSDAGEKLVRFSERRADSRPGNVLSRIVESSGLIGTLLCAALRASVLRGTGIRFSEDLSIGEDWLFFIEVAAKTEVGFLPVDTCMYRWHSGNTTLSASAAYRREQIATVRQKVSEADYFRSLPVPARRNFYYQFLLCDLSDDADRQERILESSSFRSLPGEVQAELARLVAADRLLGGAADARLRPLLKRGLTLKSFDWKAAVLMLLLALHPRLARLAVCGRRGMRRREMGDLLLNDATPHNVS